MSAPDQSVTIKDIARMADVSIGTVDRVLHNRGRVRPETEARIREAIEKTGYEPAVFASRLSKSRTSSLGIIMPLPDQDSGYWELCRKGLERTAVDLRLYNVAVNYYHFDRHSPASAESAVQEALDSGAEGFLIAPVLADFFTQVLQQGRLGKNIVLFDSDIPDADFSCCVSQDGYASGRLAARLLLQSMYEAVAINGNRPFLLFAADISGSDYHLKQRLSGFLAYLEERSIRVHTVQGEDGDAEPIRKQIQAESLSLAGVFVPNAMTHAYSADSIGIENLELHLVGYDAIPENLAGVRNGEIDYLISQRPEEQAAAALGNLYRSSILRKEIPHRVVMPIDIVALENLLSG